MTNSTTRQPVVLHVPTTTTITNDYNQQSQQIIFSSSNGERKQAQQIFFINNKPYIIQQKLTHDQLSQQRLVLTPSITQSDGVRNQVETVNGSQPFDAISIYSCGYK
ncbi:unnamed protein product [Rotaria sp. Silwood2]|nr:unnamed protein product [Rotaria sp. Silwood2]CAF4403915.1 unnamed protein product [Rotaria sp. Silwood2]